MGKRPVPVAAALRHRILLIVAAGVLMAASVMVAGAPEASATPAYAQIIQSEAAYVASAQVHTCQANPKVYGAIAEHPLSGSTGYVEPYFANYGVRALIAAGGPYLADAKAWFQWYLNNLNSSDTAHATSSLPNGVVGSVYTYNINLASCTETATTDKNGVVHYDSSDAYAATFLTALGAYSVAPGADIAWLKSNASAIQEVARASIATLQSNGLTTSTPTWPFQYLMDNVEVYQGLMNYAWLLDGVLSNASSGAYVTALAQGVRNAIYTYLPMGASGQPNEYAYNHATTDPPPQTPLVDNWSDCSAAADQLWPIFAGLGTAAQRNETWAIYKFLYPGWDATTPGVYPDLSCTDNHQTGSAASYAAAVIGDRAAADAGITGLETNWRLATNPRPWSWNVADSGFLAMAAALQEQ